MSIIKNMVLAAAVEIYPGFYYEGSFSETFNLKKRTRPSNRRRDGAKRGSAFFCVLKPVFTFKFKTCRLRTVHIKTQKPGRTSTAPRFTTEIKKKTQGTHKGETAIFDNQLPLVKTVINGVFFNIHTNFSHLSTVKLGKYY